MNPLVSLASQKNLSEKQSESLFLDLFRGKLSEATSKSLLLLLAKKGETPEEVSGCLKALRKLEPPKAVSFHAIDTCGTGGDKSHSLNVSTLSAFVVAGAGGKVAKHGNRSLSSKCGSSDLMEALGIKLDAGPKPMIKAIEKCGIGYFHAPFYHPIFAKVQPLRKRLGIRTIFNFLGPMANPLKLKGQLVGVSSALHLKLYTEILRKRNTKRALICHSLDGMDELSTASASNIVMIEGSRVRKQTLQPERLGFRKARKKDFMGGTAKKNAAISLELLKGKKSGPLEDIIVLNSGAALWVAGIAKDIRQGIGKARFVLKSGRAFQVLEKFKKISSGKS